MAYFNASELPGEFYKQTISALCSNTKYEFAAWIANVLKPAALNGVKPDISFIIQKIDGTTLASFATGPISQRSSMTWEQFGFFFSTPPGINTVVLKMVNTNPGGLAVPGNDLAIDDITFRPCGPSLAASFSSSSVQTTKSQCGFTTVNLYGTTSSGYESPSFQWQVSEDSGTTWMDLPSSNNLNLNYTPTSTGSLSFRFLSGEAGNINSSSCRVASNVIKLSINQPPQVTFSGNTICKGEQGQLKFLIVNGTGPYTVIYNNGVTNTTVNNVSPNAVINVSPNPSFTTTYTLVSVADAVGCFRTSGFTNLSATITVPVVTINSPAIICAGDSLQLNATGGGLYLWTPSTGLSNTTIANPKAAPALTTSYKVVITANGGCKDSATTTTTVKPAPILTVSNDTLICLNGVARLWAAGAQQYKWSPSAGVNNTNITSPDATPAVGTKYYVTGINTNGCEAIDSVKVDVKAEPVFLVNPGVAAICSFKPLQLKASGGDTYVWQPAKYLSNPNVPDPVAQPDSSIIYSVTIGDTYCNIQSTLTVPVTVNHNPVITILKDNDITCNQPSSQLRASGASTYSWSPASGLNNSNIANPVATVNSATTFFVRGTTDKGCQSSDSIKVNFLNSGNLEALQLPNAFTPNADGLNDCFGIKPWGNINVVTFDIYNRWGEVVFKGKNNADCWNGSFRGIPQQTGAFPYVIKVKTACGTVERKGVVLLLR